MDRDFQYRLALAVTDMGCGLGKVLALGNRAVAELAQRGFDQDGKGLAAWDAWMKEARDAYEHLWRIANPVSARLADIRARTAAITEADVMAALQAEEDARTEVRPLSQLITGEAGQ